MIKKFLALAFLITSFLLAGNAYGEDEVYYCVEIDKGGFNFDKKSNSYQPTNFFEDKFKMKLDKGSNAIELAKEDGGREKYICDDMIFASHGVTIKRCTGTALNTFMFNANNGQFTISRGTGYVLNDIESLYVSYGKCDKF